MEDELAKAAQESVWPGRVAEFTRWVGGGRKLTQTGRLTLADARALVARLGTRDVIDPVIGEQTFRTKSSEELTELTLTLEWARAVGLVRRQGNQLMTVKKRAGLINRPAELWERMFDAVSTLGPVVCPEGWGVSLMRDHFDLGLGVLLAATDMEPAGVDVEAAAGQIWAQVSAMYELDDVPAQQVDTARHLLTRDVRRMVQLLAQFGVFAVEEAPTVDPEQRERGAGVTRLTRLTELGRWAVRRQADGPAIGDPVIELRVELVDTQSPQVWRRLSVPADWTLDRLHSLIQVAMGWHGHHLHLFAVGGSRYGPAYMDDVQPEESARVGDVLSSLGDRIGYEYDFGDGWQHDIVVQALTVAEPTARYPRCVAGQGACPPEDCGGIPGYEALRAALADPADPQHRELLAWLGLTSAAEFDPVSFDRQAANLRIAAVTSSVVRPLPMQS